MQTTNEKSFQRTRNIATALLLLMFTVFLGTFVIQDWPYIGWIRAVSEAALVGGLADWFAVSALFRRPLGLPIPHTAIIPANQTRIADALGAFVQSNFLSEIVLLRKVRGLDVGARLAAWLNEPETRRKVAAKSAPLVSGFVQLFDEQGLRSVFGAAASSVLRDLDAAKMLAHGGEIFLAHDSHQRVFDEGLLILERMIDRHQTFLREALRREMPWYIPNFIHDKVYRDVLAKVRASLQEANKDPQHQLRQDFTAMVKRFSEELRTDGALARKVNHLWCDVMASSLLHEYVGTVVTELQGRIAERFKSEPQVLVVWFERTVETLASSLNKSEKLRSAVNLFAERLARGIARNFRGEIAGLVSETVRSWDSATLVEKLEVQVGPDLQFIRINGTVVGGIIGSLIYAVTQWMG